MVEDGVTLQLMGLAGAQTAAATMANPASTASLVLGVPMCQLVDDPGVREDPSVVDYSLMPASSPDQERIEAVLAEMDLGGRRLLHVGVGNSLLARRFVQRCASIDGITISPAELERAKAMRLPNYRAFLANKYRTDLLSILCRDYDIVIDNNLASYACCGFHLLVMFSNYRLLLRRGGSILTDQGGMSWAVHDSGWRLGGNDLAAVGERFGMSVRKIDAHVYAMTKG